jgi:hypothetical protein
MQHTKLKSLIPVFENKRSKYQVKTTVLKPRTVYYHECPHCGKEIHEKHTYCEPNSGLIENSEDRFVEYHSDCKMPIKFYKFPEEQQQEAAFLAKLKSSVK